VDTLHEERIHLVGFRVIDCALSYFFYLYLMVYACAIRFDVTGNVENFTIFWKLNRA